MTSVPTTEEIDAVILCGGLGTRLRGAVNDRPKVMAEINGRPFMDLLIDYISGYKFRRFVLCLGYMGSMIREHFEKRDDGIFLFAEEKELLGTAGAIKNAEALIKSTPFLVVNGDSFCRINLDGFLSFHYEKKAFASISLVMPEREADYGVVTLDEDRRILSFNEKATPDTHGLVNAGIYFFNREILDSIPVNTKYSLEYELFPRMISKGIYGYVTKEKLIDIGTPERYKNAGRLLAREN